MDREEMTDFILSAVNELENLTPEDNFNLLCELNNMTYEELEKEAYFYEELMYK